MMKSILAILDAATAPLFIKDGKLSAPPSQQVIDDIRKLRGEFSSWTALLAALFVAAGMLWAVSNGCFDDSIIVTDLPLRERLTIVIPLALFLFPGLALLSLSLSCDTAMNGMDHIGQASCGRLLEACEKCPEADDYRKKVISEGRPFMIAEADHLIAMSEAYAANARLKLDCDRLYSGGN